MNESVVKKIRHFLRDTVNILSYPIYKLGTALYKPRASIQDIRRAPWFRDNGDKTLRLNYNLSSHSLVFDLGGYDGQWTSDIYGKYAPTVYVFEVLPKYAENIKQRFIHNQDIQVFAFGLSNKSGKIDLSFDENATSAYKKSSNTAKGLLKDANIFL